ncbi:nicotinate-nucleotide--dimethylbenzimidazole phosphoribosyltransferase [Streptomyces sp. MAR4 CNX-425]|uniref:nicotinate-nucleotide--dimethylbenzimidazole phosphoribosyltransferase n=1 Tax=Streptomyces sp. MAR4 CNX-425 TaxID=3406343 RepID=UPI003B5008BD
MTDTGKLPEGHQPGPDDAAGGHPAPASAGNPETAPETAPRPAAEPAAAPAADDDDLLFLPGAQGAWTDPRTAAPAAGAEPATGGQRRPLHMGPPVPETAGGVVRSLADRGPARAAEGGNATATGAGSAAQAPGGPEEPGTGPGTPATAEAAPAGGADPAAAAAGHAAAGAVGAAGDAAATVPQESVPAAAGPVPQQVAEAAGQAPHPPLRTPGPPTTGPEYLDVTRAGATHLPGPQLGEIPPAPAGWAAVSHPAHAETVAPAQPHDPGEAAPARDGATAAAPAANEASGTPAAQDGAGTSPDAGAEPADAAGTAGAQPAPTRVSAGVDAAQAAVARAAASAGASLGRGVSMPARATTAAGDQDGPAAGGGPADAAAPAAVPATGSGGGDAAQAATTAVPHEVRDEQPGAAARPGAAGRPADGSADNAAADGRADDSGPGAADIAGGTGAGQGSAAQGPGTPASGGQVVGAAGPQAAGDGGPGSNARAGTGGQDPAAGADEAAESGPAAAAADSQAGHGSPAPAVEQEPVEPVDAARPDAHAADDSPSRTDRPGDSAEPSPADGVVLHAVTNGQPVNGARARAAHGPAAAGGQPAVPAARGASDEAAPAPGAVHAAAGARRGVSLGIQNGAQAPQTARAAQAGDAGAAADGATDAAAVAPDAGDETAVPVPRAGASVAQLRGRRRRGSAVNAPVAAAASAAPGGDAETPDPAAAPGAAVPAQATPAPGPAAVGPAPAASTPPGGTPAPAAATHPATAATDPAPAGPVPAADVPADPAPAADAPAADAPDSAATDADSAPAATGAPDPAAAPGAVAADPAAPGFADAERAAVHRVMRERRDIRNGFRSDPVPHEVLLRVLEAAHTAPSVGHSQPWDFVVIRAEETRHRMHELARRQREAYAKSLPKGRAKQFKELKVEAIRDTPVNIVVTADPTRGGRHTLGRHTQPQMAPYSSALAVENLWLAARAEGLGVGWVSFFDERELVRELDLPEHLDVVAYLCVGYVDEFPDEPELVQSGWSKRRPLSWVVHEESYGRRALPGEDPHDLLAETLEGIRPLDAKALGEAWERQKRMTKPAGSLGVLEIISAQLCGLSRTCPPPVPEPAAVAVFAGDHGVHAQGVTPWPQEVTGQMVANFLGGGAVCNAFATQVGAEVCVVDAGVAAELPAAAGLVPRKVRAGTADMTVGPAMSREEALRAVEVGIETARDLVAAGNKALLTGEMGIANTTASAAVIAVFTDTEPAEVTGRGTGIDDETHARKVEAVRRAIEVNRPDPADPIGVLAAVGGLEHAALVGFILGGSALRTPVVLDGVSAGAAALVARAVAPEALAACIAGHRSPEPGHAAALTKLGLRPLIDLDLRLGEGTGALLALPLVQSAARAMHEVATFDAAGVTEKG